MFLHCLGRGEIRCHDTTGIHYPVVVALLRLPPGCPLMFCITACHLPVWMSCWVHFGSDLPGLWCIHWRGLVRAVILVVGPLWADEEQSSSFQAAQPLFFPGVLLQPTVSVLGWLHTEWAGSSAAWTGLCCKHPQDRSPQPPFVLSSGILHTGHMEMQLHSSHVHFPRFLPEHYLRVVVMWSVTVVNSTCKLTSNWFWSHLITFSGPLPCFLIFLVCFLYTATTKNSDVDFFGCIYVIQVITHFILNTAT